MTMHNPSPNEDQSVDYTDKTFHNGLMELADEWNRQIRTEGACVKQNAHALFCRPFFTNKAINNYCRGCPCRTQCLGYAVATDQTGAVWGGFDETYRAGIEASVAKEFRNEHEVDMAPHCSYNATMWAATMARYEELASNPVKIYKFNGILSKKKKKDKNYLVI